MARRVKALLAAVLLVSVAVLSGARPAAATGVTFVDIPGDGVTLKANVVAPADSASHPALIFPSGWRLNDAEYLAQAVSLASTGYVVVSYTPRGRYGSGGYIDTDGPLMPGRSVPPARHQRLQAATSCTRRFWARCSGVSSATSGRVSP